jgi:outer membrane immunogenic protein
MKNKMLLLSPLALLPVGAQSAAAAPPPPHPVAVTYPPSWAGFYVGANLGGISAHSGLNAYSPNPGSLASYCFGGPACSSFSQTASGVLGGGQIGYNFQSANWVYGIEADFDFSNARKTVTAPNGYAFSGSYTTKTGVRDFGTARLRLGYAFDRALVYATGGLAYANMTDSFQAGNSAPGAYAWTGNSGWRAGYTVGGGIEYMLSQNFSIKGEGLFYDLGSVNHVDGGGPLGSYAGLSEHMTGALGRIGINYLFH